MQYCECFILWPRKFLLVCLKENNDSLRHSSLGGFGLIPWPPPTPLLNFHLPRPCLGAQCWSLLQLHLRSPLAPLQSFLCTWPWCSCGWTSMGLSFWVQPPPTHTSPSTSPAVLRPPPGVACDGADGEHSSPTDPQACTALSTASRVGGRAGPEKAPVAAGGWTTDPGDSFYFSSFLLGRFPSTEKSEN